MTRVEIDDWRRRKAEIVKRYGSADAATAPCEREKLLLAAVAAWRTTYAEWTDSVDGWRGSGRTYREMPTRALQAIKCAIPLPASFCEAKSEADYWDMRNAELLDVLGEDGTFDGDIALDLVAEVRAAIVRDLALHELRVDTLADLHARCMMYRAAGAYDPRFEEAMFRDIDAMAEAATTYLSASRTDPADLIEAALSADPSRSDRDVARSVGCSPTTVGRVRASLGLQSSSRAVSRGGRRFEMRIAAAQTTDAG